MTKTVFSSLVITVAMLTDLTVAPPAVANRAETLSLGGAELVVGQAAVTATSSERQEKTQRIVREVGTAVRAIRLLEKKHTTLREVYNQKLIVIDKLSRQRTSWRRDRKIGQAKGDAQVVANRLRRMSVRLSAARHDLRNKQVGLLRAVDAEIKMGASGNRLLELSKLRSMLVARLRPRVRKIILPDDVLDRLSDPEELEEQAALIARAERQLLAEDQKLKKRLQFYVRRSTLRSQSVRAREISQRDPDSVRRSPGIGERVERFNNSADNSSGGGSGGDGGDGDPLPSGGGGGNGGGGNGGGGNGGGGDGGESLESSSVVLADVIDAVTAKNLRRAGRSNNPDIKAKATKRARQQLRRRLERLIRQRRKIEQRAKALRAR